MSNPAYVFSPKTKGLNLSFVLQAKAEVLWQKLKFQFLKLRRKEKKSWQSPCQVRLQTNIT